MADPIAKGFVEILPDKAAFDKGVDKLGDGNGPLKAGEGIGKKIAGGIAAIGIGAIAVKGITDGLNLGEVNAKLGAQLGLTADVAARYGKIAGDVYANNYGESVGAVSETIKSITQQIGEGSDTWLKETSKQALNFTSGFEQDMSRTTAAVGTLIKTGMAKDSTEAFDILTKGMQLGVDKGEDLLDTMIEYPTVLSKLGLNAKQSMGLLNQGLQAGARNSDVVADALKEFQIRATDGSTASAAGFKALGLSATDMTKRIAAGGEGAQEGLSMVLQTLRETEDPVKRNAAAVALFGTKAEDLGDALFALDPGTAVASLGEVGGAAEKMGNTLGGSTSAKLETFKRKALMGIANVAAKYVIPAGERIAAAVGDFWTQKGPGIQSFIAGSLVPALRDVGDVFASIGRVLVNDVYPALTATINFLGDHEEVLIGLGVVVGTVLVVAFAAWAVSTWAVVAPMIVLWAPIIAVGVALGALVAGVIYAYEHWGWFKTAVDAVIDAMQWLWNNVLSPFIGWLSNDFTGKLEVVGRVMFAALTFGMSEVAIFIYKHFDEIVAFVSGIPGKIGDALAKLVEIITEPFAKGFDAAMSAYNNTIGRIPGAKIEQGTLLHDYAAEHRAGGGSVLAGRPYVVGERRAELFVPDTNGVILPSVPGAGGGMTNNFYGIAKPRDVLRELSWAWSTRGGRV